MLYVGNIENIENIENYFTYYVLRVSSNYSELNNRIIE